jgi:chromate transporter
MTWHALLFGPHGLQWADLWALFLHFLMLSVVAIGGAITTAPDMHRYVVGERGWLTDAGFTASVALAQAAPGPNVLFVAVIGYNVAGLTGVAATLGGSLIPSTAVALAVARWGHARRRSRGVRAFSAGLAPVTVGLVLSTGWVLAAPAAADGRALALVALTVVATLRTKIGPLWLLAAGAVVGAGAAA